MSILRFVWEGWGKALEYNVFLMWILSSIYIKLELFIAVTYLVESIVFDKFFFSLPFIFFLLFTIVVNYTCAYLHPSTKNTQFFLLKTYFLLFFVSSSSDLLFQVPMYFKISFFSFSSFSCYFAFLCVVRVSFCITTIPYQVGLP